MSEQTRKPAEAAEPVVETAELTTADLEQASGGTLAVASGNTSKVAKGDNHSLEYVTFNFERIQ